MKTPSGSKTEEELRKAARRKKLPEEGWYDDGEIEDATETTSQKENDVFKCPVSFTDKVGEKWTLTAYLQDHPKNPQTGLLLRHACAARGVLAKFEAGSVEASDLPGPVRLKIRHRKQRGWPDRLEVEDFAAVDSSVAVDLRARS